MVFVVSFEFFFFIVAILAFIAIAVGLCILAVSLWTAFATLSVIFSRLALAIFISAGSYIIDFDFSPFESGFLNVVVRTAIIYGILWIFSKIPRVDAAVGAVCTFFVSLFTSLITLGFCFFILDLFIKPEVPTSNGPWFPFALGICVAIATLINWVRDIDRMKEVSATNSFLANPLFIRIGRVLASVVYGFVIFLMIGITFNAWFTKIVWIQYVIFGLCIAGAYVADLFLFDRAAPPKKEK